MFTLSFIQNNITPPAKPEILPEKINVSGDAFDDLPFAGEFMEAAKGEYIKTTIFENEGYVNTKVGNNEGPCLIKFDSYTTGYPNYETVSATKWQWRITAGANGTTNFYKLSDDLFDSTPWRKSEDDYVNLETDPIVESENIIIERL